MNEIEYASRYLGDYRIHGAEIVPTLCPFCVGGSSRDKNTFALNMENHTYNCKRGSCGVSGHFSELLREKGETYTDSYYSGKPYIKPKPEWKTPETKPGELTQAAKDYITARKITQETAEAFGVSCDGKGNLVFPYYRTADDREAKKPTFIKFRIPAKVTQGRKMWREANTMPILYNLDRCDPTKGGGILYITEGEFDAMALWQASGGTLNVTSVPSGAEDFTWIETCAEDLKKWKNIGIVGDNDLPGIKMAQEIAAKLGGDGVRVFLPDYNTYRGCKDANEILVRHGEGAFPEILSKLSQPPVKGLIDISDVRRSDVENVKKTRSGLKAFDKETGGFFEGDITVWTGKRGSGKSTFLNQLILQSIDDGTNVCIYSGEIPADRLKNQIMLCAAGYLHVDEHKDTSTGRTYYTPRREEESYINDWMRRKIWLYDNKIIEKDERDSIIDRFTAAYRQYDCRVFVVDNLMTVNCNSRASEVMQIQADFVIRLRKFAELYNCHVHVVVHPRKTKEIEDADDVGGMGAITNIACNVFSVKRNSEEGRDADGVTVNCLKNRAFGAVCEIALKYDNKSRRFSEVFADPIKYGWELRWETDHPKPNTAKGQTS